MPASSAPTPPRTARSTPIRARPGCRAICGGRRLCHWTNGSAYVDAVGQYGYSDWTFSPTAASSLTINGHTALTALEAGVRIGDDELSVTPWSQLVWQGTLFEGLDSAWVGAADFAGNQSLNIRGGLRAEGRLGAFAPYLDLSVSHDVNDRKTVSVDGFDITTGMGGTRVELGTGFEASVSDSMELWTQLKGAYGVGAGDARLSGPGGPARLW